MIKKVKDLYSTYKKHGWDYFLNIVHRRVLFGKNDDYGEWVKNYEGKYEYVELDYQPLISIIVPVYNVKEYQLEKCIESVISQKYKNWQLCLADDASTMPCVREVLSRYEEHEQIDVVYRTENGHISRCTNSGLQMAKGEFIAFLDCDDYLSGNALYEVAAELNRNPDLDFIYSDEDLVTENGNIRFSPRFKTGWMPDNYMSHNYTNHFSVYRGKIVKKIGGLRVGYEGLQDYDFVLRFIEHTTPERISHINKILYHWRSRPESLASGMGAKDYACEAARKATVSALQRNDIDAAIKYEEETKQWNVIYRDKTNPMIDIVIISSNNSSKVRKTIQSVRNKTEYINYKICLVSYCNGHDVEEQYKDICMKYNCKYVYAGNISNYAKLCNLALKNTNGENVVFLKDDVEILSENWIYSMAGQLTQEHVGSAGGKVLFPNQKYIDHIGYVYMKGFFGKVCEHTQIEYNPFSKLNNDFQVVSSLCYMIKRNKLESLGGFDEEYETEYAMIDINLALLQQGYYNAYRADVCLRIQEFTEEDRKKENFLSNSEELKKIIKKYPNIRKNTIYYNPNCSQVEPTYRIAKGTTIYREKPKELLKKAEIVSLKKNIKMFWKNQRLQISGDAWSEQIKRKALDQIWISFHLKNGKERYIRPFKEYLGGYAGTIYEKNGRKWSGFSGEVSFEKEELCGMKVNIYIIYPVSKKIFMVSDCEYTVIIDESEKE